MIRVKRQIVVNRCAFRKVEGKLEQLEDLQFLTTIFSTDQKSLHIIMTAINDRSNKRQAELVHTNLLTTSLFADEVRDIIIKLVLNKKKWTEIKTDTDGNCFMIEWI